MTRPIALIGAGAMGGAIGARLVTAGTLLTVFDLEPDKVAALTNLGATSSPSPADAATCAQAIILSRNAPRIVRAAVFSPGGVAEGATPGTLILAIDWPDRATVDAFLTHPIRKEGRAAKEAVLARHFTGRIHHHVTTAHSFAPT